MAVATPSSTDPTLLRKVKANDAQARHDLVQWVGPLIHSWCRQARLKDDDLETVMQDVFLAIFRDIAKFQAGPGSSFRGWLRIITKNKIIDLARSKLRQPAAVGDEAYRLLLDKAAQQIGSEDPASDTHSAAMLMRRALDQIRGDFDPIVWQSFLLTAVEGRSAPEAAQMLGKTADAVRQAKRRVLQRLREEFGNLLS